MENKYEVVGYLIGKDTIRYPTSAEDAGKALERFYRKNKESFVGIRVNKLSKLEKN